jgi:hypothetical protein
VRLRRSSIATIPDSPSSISLSVMIATNAELSQNASYVPGFPLPADDTRSVRSIGFVKKSDSVSRLIRRMRGEGLSKHYWMADEHCKECYDCKSVCRAPRPELISDLYRMEEETPLSDLRADILQPMRIQHHRCASFRPRRSGAGLQPLSQDHGRVPRR